MRRSLTTATVSRTSCHQLLVAAGLLSSSPRPVIAAEGLTDSSPPESASYPPLSTNSSSKSGDVVGADSYFPLTLVVERPLLPPLLPALLLPVLPDRTTSSGGMRKPVPMDAATMRKKKNTNKGTFPLLLLLEK